MSDTDWISQEQAGTPPHSGSAGVAGTIARSRADRPVANRLAGLDIARLAMAVIVVFAHGRFLFDVSPQTYYFLFLGGYFRVVIPLFILITGYYFARSLGDGPFGHWLKRPLMLYVIWSVVYLAFWGYVENAAWQKIVFYAFFGIAHLWYLATVIGGAVVLYLVRNWKTAPLLGLAFGLYTAGVLLQLGLNITLDTGALAHRGAYDVIPRNFLTIGAPFLILGHLLARPGNLEWVRERLTVRAFALVLLLGLVEISFNYVNFPYFAVVETLWFNILLAPMLFTWLMGLKIPAQGRWMAPMAAAIYLIHPLILYVLDDFGEFSTIVSLAALPLCFALGAALLMLNRKLPIL